MANAHKTGKTIWHYTSVEVLHEIWKSKSLLGSDVRFLNDKTEWNYITSVFAKWYEARAHTSSEDFKKWAYANDDLDNLLTSRNYRPFVFSFSRLGDDLAMWRGYGNVQSGGKAVAIGFDLDDLSKICENSNIEAPQCCHYDPAFALKSLDNAVTPPNNFRETLVSTLRKTAPYTKHEAFKQENEWRITKPLTNTNNADLRQVGNSFRMALSLEADTTYPLGIAQLRPGPTTPKEWLEAFVDYAYVEFSSETRLPLIWPSSIPFV